MRHRLPIEALGPAGPLMGEAVQSCVHCGFCLPTCPTFGPLGQEMDTPRGRIALMKETLEGNLPLEDALPHVDRCLGCLACETSCPSGVSYRDLIGPFREKATRERRRFVGDRIFRWFALGSLTRPGLFYRLAKIACFFKPLRRILPAKLKLMLELIPNKPSSRMVLPAKSSPEGEARASVALLAGCAQSVLEPEIGAATISVLVRNEVEVFVPRGQGCCGALHWHAGEGEKAREFARSNLGVFAKDVDAVISNAAGCGSCLQEYPLVLKGDAREKDARLFSAKAYDFSVFLDKIGINPIPPATKPIRVVYQDACHLRHAQGVFDAPRKILRAVPGVELVEIEEDEICCGSAGLYNIEEPEIADELGRKKADHILAANPEVVISANIGCLVQLRHHLQKAKDCPRILHLAVFLQRAYSGEL